MEEQIICGKTINEIRKAFFKGKIKALIAEIQETEYLSELDLKKLEEYLTELQTEDRAVHARLVKKFPDEFGAEIKPPSVDELTGGDTSLDKWITEKEAVLADVRSKMKAMRERLSQKDFDIKELQDLAFELTFWRNWIIQDTIYKRQLWKRKLTILIDDYEISRREAEDRSELTKEYRDFVLAAEFQKIVEDLIISARRGYSE